MGEKDRAAEILRSEQGRAPVSICQSSMWIQENSLSWNQEESEPFTRPVRLCKSIHVYLRWSTITAATGIGLPKCGISRWKQAKEHENGAKERSFPGISNKNVCSRSTKIKKHD